MHGTSEAVLLRTVKKKQNMMNNKLANLHKTLSGNLSKHPFAQQKDFPSHKRIAKGEGKSPGVRTPLQRNTSFP